jgi:sigma-B regulation protein RsbU (phosphoserine phosphatase)
VLLALPAIPGWEIASDYRPAREIGGDFFDVFPILEADGAADRRLGIVIADVAGKGISAAILMAFVRPVMRAALDRTGDPALALDRTNHILVEERPTGLLVTILCGVLDLKSGELIFANAGHEWPLLVPVDGSPVRELGPGGPLVGAFRQLHLTTGSVVLGQGDLLALYTDGVTDALTAGGERYGLERFVATLSGGGDGGADRVVRQVMAGVTAFEGPEPADDIALLVIRRSA